MNKDIARIAQLWCIPNLPQQVYNKLHQIRIHLANGRRLEAYEGWIKMTENKYLPNPIKQHIENVAHQLVDVLYPDYSTYLENKNEVVRETSASNSRKSTTKSPTKRTTKAKRSNKP